MPVQPAPDDPRFLGHGWRIMQIDYAPAGSKADQELGLKRLPGA